MNSTYSCHIISECAWVDILKHFQIRIWNKLENAKGIFRKRSTKIPKYIWYETFVSVCRWWKRKSRQAYSECKGQVSYPWSDMRGFPVQRENLRYHFKDEWIHNVKFLLSYHYFCLLFQWNYSWNKILISSHNI